MTGLQVVPRRSALLAQKNQLLERDVGLLKMQIASLEAQLAIKQTEDCAQEDACKQPTEDELCRRKIYLERKSKKDLDLNKELNSQAAQNDFSECGKHRLLCYLQEIHLWKLNLTEAELASVVSQIWACKTTGFQDSVDHLMQCIDDELDRCGDDLPPYVIDLINDVMKDC